MSDINTLTTLAYVKASMALDRAKDKIKNELSTLSDDERGVDGIVVSLILIGLAAVAALVFRKALFGDPNGATDADKQGIIGSIIQKVKDTFEMPSNNNSGGPKTT